MILILWVMLALFAASPATAQPYPSAGPHGAPDELALEVLSDTYAVVTFYNSADHTSATGNHLLDDEAFAVAVRVESGEVDIDFAERLTVTPPPGWRAEPEIIEVLDGETGVVELFRGEFLGM